jgi:hypothetical protein
MWYERCKSCGKEVAVECSYGTKRVMILNDEDSGIQKFDGHCLRCDNPPDEEVQRISEELKHFLDEDMVAKHFY